MVCYRWRLVTLGGIDGFSRYVVYLHCSSNNRSAAVLELFWDAIQECGLPDCVRSDQGGENVLIDMLSLSVHILVKFGKQNQVGGTSVTSLASYKLAYIYSIYGIEHLKKVRVFPYHY